MTLIFCAAAFCQHRAERGAVDRRDHEHLGVLVDHVLQLGDLLVDLVVRVLQGCLVARLLQQVFEVGAVLVPALRLRVGIAIPMSDAPLSLARCRSDRVLLHADIVVSVGEDRHRRENPDLSGHLDVSFEVGMGRSSVSTVPTDEPLCCR